MGQSSQIPGGPGRREAERFNVQLNVLLPDGSGTTRNASSKGVYFVTDRPMAPGSPITFTLVFELDETETMHLRCEGEIVRVEETGETIALPKQEVITFGRLGKESGTQANDIVLKLATTENTNRISRWHFQLRRTSEGYVLRSLTSAATQADGRDLKKNEEAPVRGGSIVRLAGVATLVFLPTGPERSDSSVAYPVTIKPEG